MIFITAFPERLLTRERPKPAFLISKPYKIDTVRPRSAKRCSSSARRLAQHSDRAPISSRRPRSMKRAPQSCSLVFFGAPYKARA
nr:RNA polymerase, sigma-24 subunit, ECF subfamily [Methylocystis sp. SC2]